MYHLVLELYHVDDVMIEMKLYDGETCIIPFVHL